MGNAESSDKWNEWSKYVLKTIESDGEDITKIKEDILELFVALEGFRKDLKYKTGFYGMAAGAIPVAIYLILEWVLK